MPPHSKASVAKLWRATWKVKFFLIQAQLGIKKNLTFHVARHSFATLALAHDVPIENVARMLGHEDIRTTQIYAKVLRTTIERHATALQGECGKAVAGNVEGQILLDTSTAWHQENLTFRPARPPLPRLTTMSPLKM